MSERYKKVSLEIQKEQINRILDLEPNVEIQNSASIFSNFSDETSEDMGKEDFELNSIECRKKNWSGSSCDSSELVKPIYGHNKDIIYYDLKDEDTLPKLALEFACKVSEIKHANKIYNDKELYALRTIKIPVVKGGSIYAKYMNSEENGSSNQKLLIDLDNSDQPVETDAEDRKDIFKVQTAHAINPGYDYLQSEGDDDDFDDYDIFNKKNSEHKTLLSNSNNLADNDEPTLDEFMSKVDDRISKEKQNADLQNSDQNVNSIVRKSVNFSSDQRHKSQDYGSVCYFSWKFWLALVIIIAIIIPILYIIHYGPFTKSTKRN